MNNDSVVSFRTSEALSRLSEKTARQRGQTRSEFINLNILDTMMDFSKTRAMDSIVDWTNVILPHICTNMTEDETTQLVNKIATIQTDYFKNRLSSHMRFQKHLTDIAIKSFLQDYMEDLEGIEGREAFVVNQSLVAIYDFLHEQGFITKAEHEDKTLFYSIYMEEYGHQLIQKE